MDLGDLWRGTLTLRRAAVLTFQLPAGSNLWQATGGPAAWSDAVATSMMLAQRLDILAWQQTEDGEKGRNAPTAATPPPFFADEDAKATSIASKAERFLAQQRALRDQQPESEG